MKIEYRKEKNINLDKIIEIRKKDLDKRDKDRQEKRFGETKNAESEDIVIETRTQSFVSRKGQSLKPDLEFSAGVCKDESKKVRLVINEDGIFEEAYVDETKLIL